MKNIIEIEHLSKSFGKIKAVNDLSFSVKEGELFAFLGVNGAGKSTTISIICNSLAADSGSVIIDGESSLAAKEKLGVVFQNSVLDKALSVYDNLKSRAALYGIDGKAFENKLKTLSEALDFADILRRPVGKLSGGQRRRIDVARALIHDPKILILDEPTTGLDPQTRGLIWKLIGELRKTRKMTVFLTTHYMEEAADADYVIILDSGSISAEGTPIELKNKYTRDYITLYDASEDEISSLGVPCEKVGTSHRLSVANTAEATKLICKYPHIFRDYEIIKGKMDDVFLNATGKKLDEEGGKDK